MGTLSQPPMIERQQLSDALARLESRDREVLELSLRRRVPDEDLAAVFGVTASEVAGLRAAAVERLSQDLGVQRGQDLGHMLKELLEGETWDLVPGARPPERPPAAEPDVQVKPAPEEDGPRPAPETAPAPAPDAERTPVLDMLAADERREPHPSRGGGARRVIAGLGAALAVLVPAGMIVALTTGGAESSSTDDGRSTAARPFAPEREAVAEPFPSDPVSANRHPVAIVRGRTALLASPGGRVKARIRGKTEWKSPRVLGIVERRGEWLAVLASELKNGEVGWIRDSQVSQLRTVAWSLHADLSKRQLVVKRDGKPVRRMKIGVGRPGHPTPTGRFAVTDRLRVNSKDSPYGCCVLALTGHQTRLPEGWPGGDRLAVHATRDTSGLGRAVSLGCMRSHPRDARWMLKKIPLGSPVFVNQ